MPDNKENEIYYTVVARCGQNPKEMGIRGLHTNPKQLSPLEVGQATKIPKACAVHNKRHSSVEVVIGLEKQPNFEDGKFLPSYRQIQEEAYATAKPLFDSIQNRDNQVKA